MKENYQLYLIDFGLSSVNNGVTANIHYEETAVDLYVFQRALISATEIRGTAKVTEFTPEAFFESVLASYAEAYPAEVTTRSIEKSTSAETPQHGKKRPRVGSASKLTTQEDGVKEVNGILKTLKDVQARGRKRLMIG